VEVSKQAMIVGVNNYKDEDIPSLRGAEKDATEIRDILTKHGGFTVEEKEKRHFLVGPNATADAIRRGLSDLLWNTNSMDVVLFYFSGHGFKDSYGRGFIAPCDMEKQRPLVHGITMQEIKELALNSPNKGSVVLILDCCYAGVAADEHKGDIGDTLDTAENCFSDLNSESVDVTPSGVFVFSSSAADQLSRELSDCRHKLGSEEPHVHGAFTFNLIEGLNGGAATEKGGQISVASLKDYLHKQMTQKSQIFNAYASKEAHPEGIILARAAELLQLSTELEKIRKFVKSGTNQNLILAAVNLAKALRKSPNYEDAIDLTSQLVDPLAKCKKEMINWILVNKSDLLQQAPESARDLEKVVVHLCVERLSKELELEKTSGLLLSLVDIIENNGKANDLLPYLLASNAASAPLTLSQKSVIGRQL